MYRITYTVNNILEMEGFNLIFDFHPQTGKKGNDMWDPDVVKSRTTSVSKQRLLTYLPRVPQIPIFPGEFGSRRYMIDTLDPIE